MFQVNSYDGGAVILHALRKTIGDDLFFTLLRQWVTDNNGAVTHDRGLRGAGQQGRRPGPDGVLRHMAVCRHAAGDVPGLVADEVLEDLAPPLLGLAGALLVADRRRPVVAASC